MSTRVLHTACLLVALLSVAAPAVEAQTAAYVAGGIGMFEYGGTPFFAGAGADGVSRFGVGGGAEAGVFFDESGGVLGGLGLHAIVQPPPRRDRRVVPFASFGVGGFLGPEISLTAWHVGGGMNWWSRERIGGRLEVRLYEDTRDYYRDRVILVRTGVTFR